MMLGSIVYAFVGLWLFVGLSAASISSFVEMDIRGAQAKDRLSLCMLITFAIWTVVAIVRGL